MIDRILKLVVSFMMLVCSVSLGNAAERVTSPDGQISVTVGLKSGKPYYMVNYQNRPIVIPSHLGFLLDDGEVGKSMRQVGKQTCTKDETWHQPWGEEVEVRNHYKELTLRLQEQSGSKRQMSVVFRVFDDGVGFRSILHGINKGKEYQIQDELTEITLAHDAKAWSIPTNRTAYFEGIYTPSLLSQKDTVCTPLTIEYEDSLFLALHEAALEDYASVNLTPRASAEGVKLLTALTPWQNGVKVYCKGETKSPWRTILIGKTAGELMTNRVMLNLKIPHGLSPDAISVSGGASTRRRTHGRWVPRMAQPHKT